MATLTSASVLGPVPGCIARPQAQGFVVYNPRTDELHILNPESFCVYQLCDGIHSVAEIQSALGLDAENGTVPRLVVAFLEKLAARRLIEVINE